MSQRLTRRKLLANAAAVGGAALAGQVFGVPSLLANRSPNSKLGLAVIGIINQGKPAVNAAAAENLVALCDVDENHFAVAKKFLAEKHPNVAASRIQQFRDYRKMFDKIHKQIDAVFIAAPDHHHAAAALAAMKLGKHVYCEKPLAHSIGEVRLMMETAKKCKVMTQLGNQGHSGQGIRLLCEYIWAGAIGDVTEVYAWAPTGRGGTGGRLPTKPVPPGLHWDEWIGPMPYRDYHEELHPLQWRSWWQFGDGSVGDWGCHNLDGPFMALRLGAPTSIEAIEQFGGSDERYPLRNTIRWSFPARGDMPAVKVHWCDGYFGATGSAAHEEAAGLKQNRPAIVDELEKKYHRDLKTGGTIFVGTKGIMHAANYGDSPRIIPEEKMKAFPRPKKTLPRVAKAPPGMGAHQYDFLRACRDGKPACSNFDYGGPLSEMVLLGCLAERAGVGKNVEWDAAAVKVTNLPELNSLVHRQYRKGWGL
jgi:predicted dehydrogenase